MRPSSPRRSASSSTAPVSTNDAKQFSEEAIALIDRAGTARRVTVTKDDTTIVDGGGDAADVKGRVAQIKAEIESTDSDWDREKLQERLAKLAGGVCVIRVGAATEVELKEKKHRLEDAISATRAAVEEGIVSGGGSALVHAVKVLEDNLGKTGDEATGVAPPSSRCAGSRRTRALRATSSPRRSPSSTRARASTPRPASTATW